MDMTMKKLSPTTGTTSAHYATSDKKKYVHCDSFNRKDTIMKYTQIGIATSVALLVCIGLYTLSN